METLSPKVSLLFWFVYNVSLESFLLSTAHNNVLLRFIECFSTAWLSSVVHALSLIGLSTSWALSMTLMAAERQRERCGFCDCDIIFFPCCDIAEECVQQFFHLPHGEPSLEVIAWGAEPTATSCDPQRTKNCMFTVEPFIYICKILSTLNTGVESWTRKGYGIFKKIHVAGLFGLLIIKKKV